MSCRGYFDFKLRRPEEATNRAKKKSQTGEIEEIDRKENEKGQPEKEKQNRQSGSKPEEAVTERYSRKESQSGEAKRRGRKESQTGKPKKEKQQAVLATKSMLNCWSAKGHTKECATLHQHEMKAGLSERL